MTPWHWNAFHTTGLLCVESWDKGQQNKFWCFQLGCAHFWTNSQMVSESRCLNTQLALPLFKQYFCSSVLTDDTLQLTCESQIYVLWQFKVWLTSMFINVITVLWNDHYDTSHHWLANWLFCKGSFKLTTNKNQSFAFVFPLVFPRECSVCENNLFNGFRTPWASDVKVMTSSIAYNFWVKIGSIKRLQYCSKHDFKTKTFHAHMAFWSNLLGRNMIIQPISRAKTTSNVPQTTKLWTSTSRLKLA